MTAESPPEKCEHYNVFRHNTTPISWECGYCNERFIRETPLTKSAGETDTLQRELFAWSSATFGSTQERGPEGPLNHLRREIDEAIADPSDIVEFADMYMLLSDAASRAGHKMSDVLTASAAKLEVNKARKWGKPNAEGFSEHVREKACDQLPGTCAEYPNCQCGRAWREHEAKMRAEQSAKAKGEQQEVP